MTKLIKTYIGTLALLVAFASCKKDSAVLGVSTTPANDLLNASFDSSAVVYTYSKKSDSTGSFNTRLKYLGYLNDPYFGTTDIGLYVNANTTLSYTQFPSSVFLTSAEIILAIDVPNCMGNVGSSLNYSVYTIDSTLSSSRLYYTSNSRLHNQLGLNKVSKSTYTTINGYQVLRIPVDSTFANTMLKSNFLTSNEVFQANYKGFYIKCASQPGSEGVIYKCNLEDDLSGFYLHYKESSTAKDTLNLKFNFSGANAARFNTVKCDYSTAKSDLKSQMAGDTTAGLNNLYLKGMGTTKIKVYIPTLKSYADSFKVAVNRAEIVFNVDATNFPAGTSLYNYPSKLTLLPLDSLGKEIFALDELNSTDLARYDGGYDSDNKRYVFNIARHVQAILTGKRKNYGFHLVVADPDPTYTFLRDSYIERVAFYGKSSSLKPRLNMSYVKFRKD